VYGRVEPIHVQLAEVVLDSTQASNEALEFLRLDFPEVTGLASLLDEKEIAVSHGVLSLLTKCRKTSRGRGENSSRKLNNVNSLW
jgi:hypothetical protein